jgi:hypothetical protein
MTSTVQESLVLVYGKHEMLINQDSFLPWICHTYIENSSDLIPKHSKLSKQILFPVNLPQEKIYKYSG